MNDKEPILEESGTPREISQEAKAQLGPINPVAPEKVTPESQPEEPVPVFPSSSETVEEGKSPTIPQLEPNLEQDEKDPNAKIRLIPQDSQEGIRTYKVEISPEMAQQCLMYDRDWDVDFRKFIGPEYPYTMSPQTTQIIAEVSEEMKRAMLERGFDINRWEIGNKEQEPYVMGVLRRVCIPDTVEPIIDNTDKMARHLESLVENDPSRILRIRSFFTGAAVAEKCLATRLYQLGVKNFNLITTDMSAESVAIAALNLSVWNELLPAQERYDLRIVKGKVPKELYLQSRTIILQVGDAQSSSADEIENNPQYDALLLDNGLPYVSTDFGSKLISNIAKNTGKNGLYIATLGLDAKIKVEIDTGFHIQNILKSFIKDIRMDPRIGKFTAPYNYPHYYGFEVQEDGSVLIKRVLSDGAGRTYNWLGMLLRTDFGKFKEVMQTIKSATALSRAKSSVVTTPFKSHVEMTKMLKNEGYQFDVIEKPLEFEKFGWQQTSEDSYTKEGKVVNTDELMEICRQEDPLVLRKTILMIHPTQQES